MAAPLIPILKAVAPYVAQIATIAIPAFTSRGAEAGQADPVVAKQIQELQEAATWMIWVSSTYEGAAVQVLADKLQQALDGMEMAARESEARFAKYRLALAAALVVSGASLALSAFLLFS
jgi:hypothetical protein